MSKATEKLCLLYLNNLCHQGGAELDRVLKLCSAKYQDSSQSLVKAHMAYLVAFALMKKNQVLSEDALRNASGKVSEIREAACWTVKAFDRFQNDR